MNDAGGVRRVHRLGDLLDDGRDFIGRQGRHTLGVPLEDFARRPLDGQVVQPVRRLARFDGSHHLRVDDAGSKSRFANKPGHRGAVLAQAFAQFTTGTPVWPMICMMRWPTIAFDWYRLPLATSSTSFISTPASLRASSAACAASSGTVFSG